MGFYDALQEMSDPHSDHHFHRNHPLSFKLQWGMEAGMGKTDFLIEELEMKPGNEILTRAA